MTQIVRCLLAAVLSLACASAQRTWIIDASNAPGTHFTSLQSAFDAPAVIDGDTLLVRNARTPFAGTTSKGVRLVGLNRPAIAFGNLTIQGLTRGRSFVLKGFDFALSPSIFLRQNQGLVHVEDVRSGTQVGAFSGVNIDSCHGVTLNRCQLLSNPAVGLGMRAPAAVRCAQSQVILSDCQHPFGRRIQDKDRTSTGSFRRTWNHARMWLDSRNLGGRTPMPSRPPLREVLLGPACD